MTALPGYPVSIVGRSSFMDLANITCDHDYAILIRPNNSRLSGVNNSDSSQCQSVYCKILKIQSFMDRFYTFLTRNKSVFSFKNRSRTGKTDDFSSPDPDMTLDVYHGCKTTTQQQQLLDGIFSFQNNPKNLDSSNEMDLYFLDCFEMGKTSYSRINRTDSNSYGRLEKENAPVLYIQCINTV